MKTVSIPVSKLSKKILQKDYPGSPIRIPSHDTIFFSFFISRPSRHNALAIENKLTESIEVDLSPRMASRSVKHGHHTGFMIYRFHIDRMMEYVLAQWSAGIEATQALNNFYSHYDIDDDDYNIETAYRKWKRYKRNKSLNNWEFYVTKATLDSHFKKEPNIFKSSIPMSNDKMKDLLSKLINENISIFITNTNAELSESLVQSMQLFILKEFGHYPADEIARMTKIPITTVYRRIQNLKSQAPYLGLNLNLVN